MFVSFKNVGFENRFAAVLKSPLIKSTPSDGDIQTRKVWVEPPAWSKFPAVLDLARVRHDAATQTNIFECPENATPLQQELFAAFAKEVGAGDQTAHVRDVLAAHLIEERMEQDAVAFKNGQRTNGLFPNFYQGRQLLSGHRSFYDARGVLVEDDHLYLTVGNGGAGAILYDSVSPSKKFAWLPAGILAYTDETHVMRRRNEDEAAGLGFVAHTPTEHRTLMSGAWWGGLETMRNMEEVHTYINRAHEWGLVLQTAGGPEKQQMVARLIYGPDFSEGLVGTEFCAFVMNGQDVSLLMNNGKDERKLSAVASKPNWVRRQCFEATVWLRNELKGQRREAGKMLLERDVFEKRVDEAAKKVAAGGPSGVDVLGKKLES